jgi:hypothetical protein
MSTFNIDGPKALMSYTNYATIANQVLFAMNENYPLINSTLNDSTEFIPILTEFILLLNLEAKSIALQANIKKVILSLFSSYGNLSLLALKSACKAIISIPQLANLLESAITTYLSSKQGFDFFNWKDWALIAAALEIPTLTAKQFFQTALDNGCIILLTASAWQNLLNLVQSSGNSKLADPFLVQNQIDLLLEWVGNVKIKSNKNKEKEKDKEEKKSSAAGRGAAFPGSSGDLSSKRLFYGQDELEFEAFKLLLAVHCIILWETHLVQAAQQQSMSSKASANCAVCPAGHDAFVSLQFSSPNINIPLLTHMANTTLDNLLKLFSKWLSQSENSLGSSFARLVGLGSVKFPLLFRLILKYFEAFLFSSNAVCGSLYGHNSPATTKELAKVIGKVEKLEFNWLHSNNQREYVQNYFMQQFLALGKEKHYSAHSNAIQTLAKNLSSQPGQCIYNATNHFQFAVNTLYPPLS